MSGAVDGPDDRLDDRIGELVEAASRRWPRVRVDPAALAAFVAARRPAGADEGWLAELKGEELALACACLQGDAAAVTALDKMVRRIAEEVVARHGKGALDGKELRHEVLRRLLVADAGAPRLEQYLGRGSLEGFIRVMALRLAMNASRGQRKLETLDSTVAAAAAWDAPGAAPGETEHLRRLYRPAFEEALREALAALPARERNLIKLHYLERLPCDRLAAMYGVHETTAWRWISRATAALREDIARRFAERTGASPSAVDSLLRLVDTHVEGSLRQALAGSGTR